jgi:hypothetical protein
MLCLLLRTTMAGETVTREAIRVVKETKKAAAAVPAVRRRQPTKTTECKWMKCRLLRPTRPRPPIRVGVWRRAELI